MAAPKQLLTGFAKTARTTNPDPKRRLTIRDPDSRGLFVRINPAGTRTWLAMARTPDGKQVWATLGDATAMELPEARAKGQEAIQRIKAGEPVVTSSVPMKAPPTFRDVAEGPVGPDGTRPRDEQGNPTQGFLGRHVYKQGLRSAPEIKRQFERYLYPVWEAEPFSSIRRGKVVELLDSIEDKSGPVMADRVLATLRKMFNWVEVRDEDYTSPVVRGMRVSSAKERARKRKLSDDEIRALWADWSTAGTFGAFLQTCLLTAQRRAKVLSMKWADVKDGVWTIPAEAREKVNAGTLKLPKLASEIIAAQPVIADNPYVFAGRGDTPIGNIGHDKAALDKRVSTAEPWTIHDLRRTAKSLMARAGVRPDISERTLGHVIAGVEGVYDQHSYEDEKADALAKLAGLVELILNPPKGNVVAMEARR